MKKKVGFLTNEPAESACPHIRLKAPLSYLAKKGSIDLVPLYEMRNGKILINFDALTKVDIIVVQRYFPAIMSRKALDKIIDKYRTKVIYEIDDALLFIDEKHPDYQTVKNVSSKLKDFIRESDLVTTSTETLKKYLMNINKNTFVIPNSIDPDIWNKTTHFKKYSGPLKILISGSITHKNDLLVLGDSLENVLKEYGNAIELIFWGYFDEKLVRYKNVKIIKGFFKDYLSYANLLQNIYVDFAIVPLELNPFNKAKSGIKWMEYAACGIPGIFSNINPYSEIIVNGETGVLVKNQNCEWYHAIKDMIENCEIRKRLANNAMEEVFKKHSIKNAGEILLKTYNNETKIVKSIEKCQVFYQNKKKPKVSIIILLHNQVYYTKLCLKSIQEHTKIDYEIIIVDNGSTDQTIEYLKMIEKNEKIKIIRNPYNYGFAKGCNQGIKTANSNLIVLLNNDVIVTENWLTGMMEVLRSSDNIGIVGPLTNQISGIQKVPSVGYSKIQMVNQFAKYFRDRNRYRRIESSRLAGFCMLFRKRLVDEIGFLDESFGTGNYEDDDFCLRSLLSGYRNFIAGDVFIHHFGSRTFIGNKIDYSSLIKGNRKIFNDKWTKPNLLQAFGKRLIIIDTLHQVESLRRKGKPEAALSILTGAVKRVPEEKALIYRLASLLIENKLFNDADTILSALEGESCVEKYSLLGRSAAGAGHYLLAMEFAEKALSIDPSDIRSLCLKGALFSRLGNCGEAMRCFEMAIEINPSDGEAYTNLGTVRWEIGEREEAFSFFERGFILSPTDPDIAAAYHAVTLEIGAFKRTETVLKEASSLHPDDRRLSFMYIAILIQLEKNLAAIEEIERGMSVFGLDDGILGAALKVRERIGPKEIGSASRIKPTLSVCMIVRNEEAHIARSLRSIKGLADEVIVVDTGSQDRTRDIARVLGSRVADFEWNEDFSAARNHALSLARGTWILVIDADEALAESDHDAIRRLIWRQADQRTAFRLTTRNYTDDAGIRGWVANDGTYACQESGKGWYPSIKVRLFPRSSTVKFVYPVHEMVEPTLKNANFVVKDCIVPIHHYGRLDADKVISKGRTYFRLGFEKLKEMKGDCQALRELGIQASEIGNYEEAVNIWSEFIKIKPHDANALMNLGCALLKLRRFSDAEKFSAQALEIDPACREAALNLAAVYLINGDTERSVTALEKLIKDNPEYPPALGRLAVGYFIEGKAQMGFNCLNKLTNKGFDIAGVIEKQAEELFDNGRITQAALLLEACIKGGITSDDIQRLFDKCRSSKTESIPISIEALPNPPERQDTVSTGSALAG